MVKPVHYEYKDDTLEDDQQYSSTGKTNVCFIDSFILIHKFLLC